MVLLFWLWWCWHALTHWGQVTHICVSKLNIIGSDKGWSPGRCQAIIWTSAGILFTGPLRTNFSEILIEIYMFSFKKMHLKLSSANWQPFCLSHNVLKPLCICGWLFLWEVYGSVASIKGCYYVMGITFMRDSWIVVSVAGLWLSTTNPHGSWYLNVLDLWGICFVKVSLPHQLQNLSATRTYQNFCYISLQFESCYCYCYY